MFSQRVSVSMHVKRRIRIYIFWGGPNCIFGTVNFNRDRDFL